ncbi:MAG: hypothetical protein SGI74_10250 [Oligoflexia bacterium]|nr:hypothetical protein [Oligoflexia bacterium]
MTQLLTILIKFLCYLFASLPRRVHLLMGDTLGLIWFYIVPIRRRVALENIERAFPDWPKEKCFSMARRNFQHYATGFIEVLLLPYFDKKLFDKLVVVENREIYTNAMNKGKGLFFVSLHIGSWELMSACNAHMNIPLSVISKKFKARGLNQIWVDLRLARGIKIISAEKSTFDILRAIRKKEAIGFILDQFMGPPVGVKTTFFGHETGTQAGLALFADRTRAPVIPVYNVRLPDGRLKIIFEEEVSFMEQGSTDRNISFMTQQYTSKIEEIIKKYPEQWLWIHRRWKPFRGGAR